MARRAQLHPTMATQGHHDPSQWGGTGEDWAEVVSTQVGTRLGVPCAQTRLCIRNGRRGSISLSVIPAGYDLVEAYVELASVEGYVRHLEGAPAKDSERPNVKRPGHTLANIRKVLNDVTAPPSFEGPPDLNAYDVFIGYLIFDALVANRDRHEQNWAILSPQLLTNPRYISPSYDHGGSLGYNLDDRKRERLLEQHGGIMAWAERGTAWRFEHTDAAPTLVRHAHVGLATCSRAGAHWWKERLRAVSLDSICRDLPGGEVPGMSESALGAWCLTQCSAARLPETPLAAFSNG